MDKQVIKELIENFAPSCDNEPIANKEIINTILDNTKVFESTKVLANGSRFTIAHGMSKKELDEIHRKSAG